MFKFLIEDILWQYKSISKLKFLIVLVKKNVIKLRRFIFTKMSNYKLQKKLDINDQATHIIPAEIKMVNKENLKLLEEHFPPSMIADIKKLLNFKTTILCVIDDNKIVSYLFYTSDKVRMAGYFKYRPANDEIYIYAGFTDKRYRRRGYFENNIKYIENFAHKKNIKTLSVLIDENNKPSQNAFLKLGFEIVSVFRSYNILGMKFNTSHPLK